MKTWIGLLVAALVATVGTSGAAWAQNAKDDATQPAEPPAAEQPADASNDDGKLIYVGIAPIGIHIPTWATHPVQAGVYLGDFLIGGEYGQFSFKF